MFPNEKLFGAMKKYNLTETIKKVPDASDPNQNVERIWHCKLKFT